MKKIFAILFISVYLFNLIGYSFLFRYLMEDVNNQLVQRLDKNIYDKNDLVLVKLPMSLPYLTEMKNFERVDGQIQMNGIQYNYVQRKLAHDTLYLLCLPDQLKTNLYNAKMAFAKNSGENPMGKKNSSAPFKKSNITPDYNIVTERFSFSYQPSFVLSTGGFLYPDVSSVLIKAPTQPPDC